MRALYALLLLFVPASAAAQDKIPEVKLDRPTDFVTDVLPILRRNCIACHHGKDAKADLVLESPDTLLKGGESGPAIDLAHPDKSLLLRVANRSKKPTMPPKKNKVGASPLTPRELGLIRLWIREGAKGSGRVAPKPLHWIAPPANWNPIYATALDPTGRFVACGRGARVHIYELATGNLVGSPSDPELEKMLPKGQASIAHRDAVQSMAFSPDGSRLATGGYRTIKIWKKTPRERRFEIQAKGEIRLLAISPTAGRIAAVTGDNGLRLFNLDNGKATAEIKAHGGKIHALRFSPDGSMLLTGSSDKKVRAWKTTDGKAVGEIETPAEVTAVAWLEGSRQIATGGSDTLVRLWPMPGKNGVENPDAELKGHNAPVTTLHVFGDGLISHGSNGQVLAWDLEKKKSIRTLNLGGEAHGLALDGGTERLVTFGKRARLWNLKNSKKLADLPTDGDARADERKAVAFAGFMGREVKYREAKSKKSIENRKKEEAEQKKAETALTAASKDVTTKEGQAHKARSDREGVEQALHEASSRRDRAKMTVNRLTRVLAEKIPAELIAMGFQDEKIVAYALADAAFRKTDKGRAARDGVRKALETERSNAERSRKSAESQVTAARKKVDDLLKKDKDAAQKLAVTTSPRRAPCPPGPGRACNRGRRCRPGGRPLRPGSAREPCNAASPRWSHRGRSHRVAGPGRCPGRPA